jgi:iron complex transport system permease protein
LEATALSQIADNLLSYRRRRYYSIIGLLVLLGVVIGVACSVGSSDISLSDVWRLLLSRLPGVDIDKGVSSTLSTIVIDIRLPRIILAGLVGAALSTAGATYQGLFRNPLADPYLLGVAQGAGLGAVIGFMFNFSGPLGLWAVTIFAFCGGVITTILVMGLSRVGKTMPITTLILAGVAIGYLLLAIQSFMLLNYRAELHGPLFWLMGYFGKTQWTHVYVMLPYMLLILVPIIYSRSLNLMQLDEDQAQQLGVNVEKVKLILLLTATLITAAAVSVSGCIGFVGIIIPHVIRLIWGPDYRFLLPLAAIVGAIFLILSDTIIRIFESHVGIPVGVITAFFGVPFFLYLLRQKKRVVF